MNEILVRRVPLEPRELRREILGMLTGPRSYFEKAFIRLANDFAENVEDDVFITFAGFGERFFHSVIIHHTDELGLINRRSEPYPRSY